MRMPVIPVYFYALAAMLFWGMSFVWTTILLRYYEPITIIFIRLILSAAFLGGILLITGRFRKIKPKDAWLFFLSALFNPFLYFLGENYGVKYSTSTIAAVVIATIPVFTPIAGYLVFRERLKPRTFLGIGLSFTGVALMLVSKGITPDVSMVGILCLAGAVFSAILFSVMLKKLTETYSPLMIVTVQNAIGIVLFMPLFFIFEFEGASAVALNKEIIWSFILLAILASSLSFVFFTHTVKQLGISKANIFSNLIPVFTALFSFLLLHELFGYRKILGMLIVIAGVTISEWKRNPKPVD